LTNPTSLAPRERVRVRAWRLLPGRKLGRGRRCQKSQAQHANIATTWKIDRLASGIMDLSDQKPGLRKEPPWQNDSSSNTR